MNSLTSTFPRLDGADFPKSHRQVLTAFVMMSVPWSSSLDTSTLGIKMPVTHGSFKNTSKCVGSDAKSRTSLDSAYLKAESHTQPSEETSAISHLEWVEIVKRLVRKSGFEVSSSTPTSDESIYLRLGTDGHRALDVYPNGDIVLVEKEGDIRTYYGFKDYEVYLMLSRLKNESA